MGSVVSTQTRAVDFKDDLLRPINVHEPGPRMPEASTTTQRSSAKPCSSSDAYLRQQLLLPGLLQQLLTAVGPCTRRPFGLVRTSSE
jgi:hypothetical protein